MFIMRCGENPIYITHPEAFVQTLRVKLLPASMALSKVVELKMRTIALNTSLIDSKGILNKSVLD